MAKVEFEEDMGKSLLKKAKKQSGIRGFLYKHRIVVSIICLLIVGWSVFFIYKLVRANQVVPYSKLPADAKSKLPLSVQALYSQDK